MLEQKIRAFLDNQEGSISVVVKSFFDERQFSIDADSVYRSASTIKVFIMSELFRQVKEGLLSLSETMILTDAMLTGGDGILKELKPGHSFTLEEICTLMIILSDNMATNILIDRLGMENINAQIARLGMKKSSLQRKMMDSEAVKAGLNNYTTAAEFAAVLESIYRRENVDAESSEKMLDILKRQQVRGRLDLALPEELVIAHKTGDLDNLEHDGGIVFLENKPYLICVLTENVRSNRDGREIIGEISKMVYEEFLS